MTDRREVVSAFLDDEPFDAGELARALADTDGRALLLDLVALRSLVQPAAAPLTIATLPPQSSAGRSRHTLRWLAAAGVVSLTLTGGYVAGERSAARSLAASQAHRDDPPAPTRVITLTPGVNWHETGGGH
jgi:hypothetical protein